MYALPEMGAASLRDGDEGTIVMVVLYAHDARVQRYSPPWKGAAPTDAPADSGWRGRGSRGSEEVGFDVVAGAVFGLDVDFADVEANKADGHKDKTSDKPD